MKSPRSWSTKTAPKIHLQERHGFLGLKKNLWHFGQVTSDTHTHTLDKHTQNNLFTSHCGPFPTILLICVIKTSRVFIFQSYSPETAACSLLGAAYPKPAQFPPFRSQTRTRYRRTPKFETHRSCMKIIHERSLLNTSNQQYHLIGLNLSFHSFLVPFIIPWNFNKIWTQLKNQNSIKALSELATSAPDVDDFFWSQVSLVPETAIRSTGHRRFSTLTASRGCW